MQGLGILMVLAYLHLFFAPWKRFRRALDQGALPDAGKALNQIRIIVAINLALGISSSSSAARDGIGSPSFRIGAKRQSGSITQVIEMDSRLAAFGHARKHHRGRTTVSTSAGLPALTWAMARRSAAAISAGFSTGPSAYQPMPLAMVAKSGSGPAMSWAI